MKISFLTSGHDPFDDRIFYHMARSLTDHNHSVSIITSTSDRNDFVNKIKLSCFYGINLPKKEKVQKFIKKLKEENAEVIVCSEPLPIYAAHKYKKSYQHRVKVIYDITEWYPSKRNLCVYNQLSKWFHFIILLTFNLWTSGLADAYIFGEWYKSRPFRFLFPGKPYIFTSYYPDLKLISKLPPGLQNNKLRLSYTGKLTYDKGYENFIRIIDGLSNIKRNLKIEVKVIGWPEICGKNDKVMVMLQKKNVEVTYFDKQPFLDYLYLIRDTDIFLDLRNNDLENNHCLPIKLFYYAALERPVIFSALKAIRKEIDISSFGCLVNPFNTNEIIGIIINYLENKDKYLNHCLSARRTIEEKYNWKLIEDDFVKFLISR